jgi:hypothetical protein
MSRSAPEPFVCSASDGRLLGAQAGLVEIAENDSLVLSTDHLTRFTLSYKLFFVEAE